MMHGQTQIKNKGLMLVEIMIKNMKEIKQVL
jgi:hypothetical protein